MNSLSLVIILIAFAVLYFFLVKWVEKSVAGRHFIFSLAVAAVVVYTWRDATTFQISVLFTSLAAAVGLLFACFKFYSHLEIDKDLFGRTISKLVIVSLVATAFPLLTGVLCGMFGSGGASVGSISNEDIRFIEDLGFTVATYSSFVFMIVCILLAAYCRKISSRG